MKDFYILFKMYLFRIGALVEHCKVRYSFKSIFMVLDLQNYHNIHWYFLCPMTICMYELILLGVEDNN